MKKFKLILVSAVLAFGFLGIGVQSASAASPFRFGLKAGVAINDLKFNESAFSSANRSGFTGGLTMQFVAPLLNIGVDGSLMYTHRQNRIYYNSTVAGAEDIATTVNADYIEIPVNFRWNIGLPVVGTFVTPYLATGPDFSFLVSNANVKDAWKQKTFDVAWNFGFGLRFVNKVEVGASYGLGLTTNASGTEALYGKGVADSKNRFWTVTLAYLF